MIRFRNIILSTGFLILLAGCRGTESDRPPIHPNLNMDYQERFNAQQASPLFRDNRAMRPLVAGTVARGDLRDDAAYYQGRNGDGSFVEAAPIELSTELLLRGQDRYNIYCAPCHDPVGDGRGRIFDYGWAPAPSFHEERLRLIEDGHIFDAITNGIRTMQPYRHQLNVADRWAVVAYIRALQRSQRATADDVPADVLTRLGGTSN